MADLFSVLYDGVRPNSFLNYYFMCMDVVLECMYVNHMIPGA